MSRKISDINLFWLKSCIYWVRRIYELFSANAQLIKKTLVSAAIYWQNSKWLADYCKNFHTTGWNNKLVRCVDVNVGSCQNYILEPVPKNIKKRRGVEVLCLHCTHKQKQNTREVLRVAWVSGNMAFATVLITWNNLGTLCLFQISNNATWSRKQNKAGLGVTIYILLTEIT